jgi:hypothetical protein
VLESGFFSWVLDEVEISIFFGGGTTAEQLVQGYKDPPDGQSLWMGLHYGTSFYPASGLKPAIKQPVGPLERPRVVALSE